MRVLVIEDYELLRESIEQGLREAGFAVDTASDGAEGYCLAKSGEYDVIVLDLMLPKLDGLTLLRQLRDQGINSHVLLLTARDTPADRIKGLNQGADDYLIKPFEFGELLARVRALVRRSYHAKNPLLRIADLELDTRARTVRRAGVLLSLTPREYAILEYLAMRAGEVVTRTDLWAHIFEFNSDSTSNVVDVHVGRLRRKVDLPDYKPLIHTRRGHGYRLGEEL